MVAKNGGVFSYEQAASQGLHNVGGKAFNLARAWRWGFPVPRGAVLGCENYRALLASETVRPLFVAARNVSAEDVSSLEAATKLRLLREGIKASAFTAEEQEALWSALNGAEILGSPIAVRSSATGEDGSDYSFAGIHESVLNVVGTENLLRAIRDCQASLWTPQALAYRRRFKIDDESVACGVLICEMIRGGEEGPVAAGVAFTVDPVDGDRDTYLIEAVRGLADKLVAGSVTAQSYRSRVQLEHIEIAPIGVDAILSAAQTETLVRLLQRVHWSFGQGDVPQDVEWTFDGEQFKIVQVRPVTSVPQPKLAMNTDQPIIWSNANAREVLPSVLTIFSWSLLKTGIRSTMFAPYLSVGYRIRAGLELMRRFNGRAYLDATALQWASYDAFGVTPAESVRELGGVTPQIAVPAGDPLKGRSGLIRQFRRLRLFVSALRLQSKYGPEVESVEMLAREMGEHDFSTAAMTDLAADWRCCERKLLQFSLMHANAAVSLWNMLARQVGERALSDDQLETVLSGLFAGSGQVVSAEHAYALQGLGDLPEGERSTEEAWVRFVKAYGHRAFDEFELANPRWSEDLPRLRALARTLAGAIHTRKSAREVSKKASEHLMGVSFPTRIVLRWLLKKASAAQAMRERTKSALVALQGEFRRIALELGGRLARAGMLNEPKDVFHLSAPDLISYLEGRWSGEGAEGLVADRVRDRAALLDLPDLPASFLETPVLPSNLKQGRVPERDADGAERWFGIATSGGRVEGPARLVAEAHLAGTLASGDILVARSTDPGWTPLFLMAGGLVVEQGSYLSHGAIVAREFGIPAVVNVPGIWTALTEGEHLVVDGDRGIVSRVFGDALPSASSTPGHAAA